jgi:glycosyltransferase involved in cell wall biosynthesis
LLCQGDEIYGIGTIAKLYALALPEMSFVAMTEGPLVEWLRANGNRVDVVPGLVRFHEGGSSLSTLAKMPGVFRQARRDAARVDELLRPRGVRVVQANWRPQQIMAGFLRARGYKSVWQLNYNMTPSRLLGMGARLNHRLAAWGADLLLPASDFIGRNWQGCGVPSVTVRNAATTQFSQPNELPESPVRALVAGRMEHSKGHHLAVDAVLRARQAGFNVLLDIYGGPVEGNPYSDELKRQISSAGADDEIRFMGFRDDLRARHQDYHIGLQCRIDPEPCSLWVCETLVDGLPLVASASGGTPELVENEATGLLYRPGDSDDLTAKLLELVRDPPRLRAMRARTFQRGRRMFTVDRFARETMESYRLLFGGRTSSAACVRSPAVCEHPK